MGWLCIDVDMVPHKGLPPEDSETSHSPDHVPSTTQMGQVRIWKISDYQSKSGRIWSLGSNIVASGRSKTRLQSPIHKIKAIKYP